MKLRILFGIIILLLLTTFQYGVTLKEQTKLPSENWSRSFPVEIEQSNYSRFQGVSEKDGYTISLLDFNTLVVFSCDEDLKCKQDRANDELNTYKNSWSDKENSYYVKDSQLIHWTSTEERVIGENVDDFFKSDTALIYWTEDHHVIVMDDTLSEIQRFELDLPIYFAKMVEDELIVVTENKGESRYTVIALSDNPVNLFSFQINATETLSSVDFILSDDEHYILLTDKEVIAGGGRGKTIQTASFDLTSNQSPVFKNLSLIDQASGQNLKDIRFLSLFKGQSGDIITFTANMRDVSGEKVNKVFVGDFDMNTIHADAVTKKEDLYIRPLIMNDQTIAFFKVDGKNRVLQFSSSIEEKKTESMEVMDGDFKTTFYSLLTIMFNGVILLILCFFWIVPSIGITYGIQFISKRMNRSFSHRSLLFLHVLILFVVQLLLIFNYYQVDIILLAAPFLSTNWQLILLLFGSSIVSVLPLLIRYHVNEDNFHFSIFYTTLMDLAILFVLIGPYVVF